MARTIEIDSVDETALIRLADMSFSEAAFGGEVGIGGFDRDDLSLGDVPAMKTVTVDESAASPTRLFTGYTSVRDLDRGVLGKVENRRQWDVMLLDLNTCLDDEVFQGSGANRPAETDYDRVTWLLATPAVLNNLGVTAGVVPNTNTVTMDARDYRHEGPRIVLDECAEAAKKNYFLYDFGSGHKLYYDLATGTSLSSSLTLSSLASDVDLSTCFPLENPKLTKDPTRVYSAVDFAYANGYVYVNDAGVESTFRRREVAIGDTSVTSAAKATAKATAYLEAISTEVKTFTASVSVPAANVNDIRAGQRIQVKCPHLSIAAFTWMRISRRTVTPEGNASGERYTIALEFAEDLLPHRYGGGTPTGDTGDAFTVGDGLTRYLLQDETGSQSFGPFIGTYSEVGATFSFGTLGGLIASEVIREVAGNISWPYTDCGAATSGAHAGCATTEAWYRFEVTLSPDVTGVRFTIEPCTVFTLNADASSVLIAGCAIGADPTDRDQFTILGSIVAGIGGVITIPRANLQDAGDGPCWFVLAPGWDIPEGWSYCVDTELDLVSANVQVDPNDLAPLVSATTVVSR